MVPGQRHWRCETHLSLHLHLGACGYWQERGERQRDKGQGGTEEGRTTLRQVGHGYSKPRNRTLCQDTAENISGGASFLRDGWANAGLLSFLSELVSEEPFVVKLQFEPAGRPESPGDYYLMVKENLCVVCGKKDSYIR